MNPDNPYAAPQTIEPRLGSSLPVADLAGRNLFPELSTEALRKLAAHSQAIDNMSLIWGTAAVFAGMVAWQVFLGWLSFVLLAGMRAWTGNRRSLGYERFNMFLDTLLAIVLLSVIVAGLVMALIANVNGVAYVAAGIFIGLAALIACQSAYAHFSAPELYGNYPHRELVEEVAYRKRHRIV